MNIFYKLHEELDQEYRGTHTAPTRNGDNAPIYDLTQIYPDDIYTPKAAIYYGDEAGSLHDQQVIRLFMTLRGDPEAKVKIYRAVPNNESMVINTGDWVTISKKYAKRHGESTLRGDYKVEELTVPAKTLYTDANSLYEFGYDPT
jgi:hypothetical protein